MIATLCIRTARRVYNGSSKIESYSDEDLAEAFTTAYNSDPNIWKWKVSYDDSELPVVVRGMHGDIDYDRSTAVSNKMLLALSRVAVA